VEKVADIDGRILQFEQAGEQKVAPHRRHFAIEALAVVADNPCEGSNCCRKIIPLVQVVSVSVNPWNRAIAETA
jgi:hypothetical protein